MTIEVGPGLTRNCFLFGKSAQNSPKPLLILCSSRMPCVFCLYRPTLLKCVGYYDWSVLSISVMAFQTTVWMGCGWVGGVSSIHFFFIFAMPLSNTVAPNP